jgi:hypothetical protein
MDPEFGSPPTAAKLVIGCGAVGLLLIAVNSFTLNLPTETIDPAFGRSSVLAGVMAVGLMLVGVVWTRANPAPRKRVNLAGNQGLEIAEHLDETLRNELAWGSAMFLKATAAASILLIWDENVLLRRGILGRAPFEVGPILIRAKEKQQQISLVNLALYPGATEFSYLPQPLPAVLITPLLDRGWLVLGGWSARCFSESDERWAQGWADKIKIELQSI